MGIRIEIEGKGQVAEFPDGTSQSVIDSVIQRDFFSQQEHPIPQEYPKTGGYSPVGNAAKYVGGKAYGVGKEALDQVGGMAETGLALGSGLLQLPVKAMAGIGGLARGISTDSQDEAVKTIRGIENFGQKFAYQPKFTESGKRVAAGMGELFSLLERGGEWLGDKAQDITSPYIGERYAAPLGAGFAIIGEAAPYFIGGKKMGGIKTAEKVVQKLIPSTMPIERHIATIVRKGTERGIKPSPSIVGRTFKERESYYDKARMVVEDVVKNKDGIELLDKHGEPLKGIIPKTVENYDHAIQQGVNRVFNSFNDKAVATTGKGIMVDVSPTVKGLKEMTTGEIGESLQRTSPETFRYASEMLKKYEDVHATGGLTATAAQRDIMTLNVGQKTVKDYTTIHKAGVDSDILESLRYATDKAITSTEGIGYQADKNLYGAYRSQQKAVNRMATKVGEKTGGLFGDYADVYTGFHAIKGLLLHDPSTLLASAGAKIIKETQKHVKHSDTIVRNMFKTTEKLMAKRPVAPKQPPPPPPLKTKIVPPTPAPQSGLAKSPLTRVGTSVGSMSDEAASGLVSQTRRANAKAGEKPLDLTETSDPLGIR